MQFQNSLSFARALDKKDPLRLFRSRFHIPREKGRPVIYFNGNSLGLQPKRTAEFLRQELEDWAKLGVSGHVHARRPWVDYHKFSKKALAGILGAKPGEVVAMNQLSANLHLLLVSFYRPDQKRFRILTEAGAFSSDQYIIASQLNHHGLPEQDALIEIAPREGETFLRTEDIIDTIQRHGDTLALILLGGVQYYTGQFFDIKKITEAGHEAGAVVGFDLAHAVGNVSLSLHAHHVDFAAWCSYKYLNSGPGAIAGIFVHEKHSRSDLHRFAGWWGHDEADRFKMKKGFRPMPGADGWQVSNHPVLQGAAHLAALEIFHEAGMKQLRKKSVMLTGFLEFVLQQADPGNDYFSMITPADPQARGCQLSLLMKKNGEKIFQAITKKGLKADWREPGVMRIAPVPLYNTFEEVFRAGDIFAKAIRS